MAARTVSVPVVGDSTFAQAIKAVAADNGLIMGELVRSALDAAYGEELSAKIALFHAKNGRQNVHSDKNKSKRKESAR